MILLVVIITLTWWSSNLSPSHSNFPLGVAFDWGPFVVHFWDHLWSDPRTICGPFLGSFVVWSEDHLWSIFGMICGLIRGSFVVHFWDHLWSDPRTICGPFLAWFVVWSEDHLWSIFGIICGLIRGSFVAGDHLWYCTASLVMAA